MIWFGRLATPIIALVIAWLSLNDTPEGEPGILGQLVETISIFLFATAAYADKVAHAIAYGALGGAAGLGYARGRRRFVMIVILGTLYGIGLEVAQNLLTDGRVSDPLDALTNFVAVSFGAAIGSQLHAAGRRPLTP